MENNRAIGTPSKFVELKLSLHCKQQVWLETLRVTHVSNFPVDIWPDQTDKEKQKQESWRTHFGALWDRRNCDIPLHFILVSTFYCFQVTRKVYLPLSQRWKTCRNNELRRHSFQFLSSNTFARLLYLLLPIV